VCWAGAQKKGRLLSSFCPRGRGPSLLSCAPGTAQASSLLSICRADLSRQFTFGHRQTHVPMQFWGGMGKLEKPGESLIPSSSCL
jgi:hypothetical protein